ncbi:LysR family transcriptional regulator [Novosphingobium gossypii]|uniref:LysR family transcriptional regulator n=1 Tax=Novosphingobium gossypii TaxID=1604774 RepID=UPI003D1FC86C
MLPPLSPNLLLVLAFLLKTKSVSSTALVLGISQPSVSRSLAKLRNALNDPLLLRSGAGMVRTRRGDELVGKLAEWVASTSALLVENTFDPKDVERRFRVASTDFGVLAVLLPALPALRKAAPGISIDILPLTHAAHRALAQGDIDLAVSGLEHDPSQLHGLHLFRDRFVCVTRPDHPLTQVEDLSLERFLEHEHLSLTVSDAELDRVTLYGGRKRRIAASVPYFGLAPDMLRAGDMVMAVPSRLMAHGDNAQGLAVRAAPDALGHLDYWLLWHERSHRDPAAVWLRDRLSEHCRTAASEPLAEAA